MCSIFHWHFTQSHVIVHPAMERALVEIWTGKSLRDPHRLPDKRSRVHAMFSGISGSYDLLNHIFSVNLDRRWRKKAVKLAEIQHGDKVLDICCGTGDLAFAFCRASRELRYSSSAVSSGLTSTATRFGYQRPTSRCNSLH